VLLRSARTYRERSIGVLVTVQAQKPSFALEAALSDQLIDHFNRNYGYVRTVGREDERSSVFHNQMCMIGTWNQSEVIPHSLDLQAGSRHQTQFVPEFFGDDDAAGLIDFDNGTHNAILPLKLVFWRIVLLSDIDYPRNSSVRSSIDKGIYRAYCLVG